ncbi:LexA family protein [Spongiibacter marinus]|uniref:LexA family protein n=1 Tax=Spongiibacter marinus TaxID=354246 RepID=UPI001EF7B9EA|nr:S24 family peptidase [Spongiibacter marinus]
MPRHIPTKQLRREKLKEALNEFIESHSTPKKRAKQKDFLELFRYNQDGTEKEKSIDESFFSQMKLGRKQIPDAFAREIEAKLGKPPFWMDTPYESDEKAFEVKELNAKYGAGLQKPRLVRMLEIEEAAHWREHLAKPSYQYHGPLYSPGFCSEIAFCVRMTDTSMVSQGIHGTYIPYGALVFIDPAVEAEPGDPVLAVINSDDIALVRTLIVDGPNKRLAPSNTVGYSTIDIEHVNIEIVGPVIGYFQSLRRSFRHNES